MSPSQPPPRPPLPNHHIMADYAIFLSVKNVHMLMKCFFFLELRTNNRQRKCGRERLVGRGGKSSGGGGYQSLSNIWGDYCCLLFIYIFFNFYSIFKWNFSRLGNNPAMRKSIFDFLKERWHHFSFLKRNLGTGCSLNIVFFSEDFKIFRILDFLCTPSVSVCSHTRQVENQRCSRTGRVPKNHKILRKKHNILWTPCI